jgi:hypothetical protein
VVGAAHVTSTWVATTLTGILAGPPRERSAGPMPVVTVTAYDQASVPPQAMNRAKLTVTYICAAAGVQVIWMNPSATQSIPAGFAIRLLIRSRAVNGASWVMGMTLGDTHDTGGLAFVFYDRVLQSAHERELDVAKLLAYAMLHEMGHLLLPPPAHTSSGIMRATWNNDDLRRIINGSMQFTTAQQSAIRAKAQTCCNPSPGIKGS